MSHDFDKFKAESKRDYEIMQNNLKEKNSLEVQSLKVKHDAATAE